MYCKVLSCGVVVDKDIKMHIFWGKKKTCSIVSDYPVVMAFVTTR